MCSNRKVLRYLTVPLRVDQFDIDIKLCDVDLKMTNVQNEALGVQKQGGDESCKDIHSGRDAQDEQSSGNDVLEGLGHRHDEIAQVAPMVVL